MEILQWLATTLAVLGVVLNNNKDIRCFPVWLVSNTLCFIVHGTFSQVGFAVRDCIFIVLAVQGWYVWTRFSKQ